MNHRLVLAPCALALLLISSCFHRRLRVELSDLVRDEVVDYACDWAITGSTLRTTNREAPVQFPAAHIQGQGVNRDRQS